MLHLFPDLCIGVTLEDFRSVGNMPKPIDWLKLDVSEGTIMCDAIFKILAENSYPMLLMQG